MTLQMSRALNLPLHKENKSFDKSVLSLEIFFWQELDSSCVKGCEDLRDLRAKEPWDSLESSLKDKTFMS